MSGPSLDPVQRALLCTTRYLVSSKPDQQELEKRLGDVIAAKEMDGLVELLNANRATAPLYQALSGLDSRSASEVASRLRPEVREMAERRLHRDALLRSLSPTLDGSGIDYVLFKTLNRSGAVGVDVDVMIDLGDFERCVNSLTDHGFYPIDDLSKKYATGFMVKGNPIILDLHTELAVLGVRYLPSSFLLESRRRTKFQPSDGPDSIALSTADETADAVVRMAHGVIKEGAVSIGDIFETAQTLRERRGSAMRCVETECLQLAASVFLRVASAVSTADGFGDARPGAGLSQKLAEKQLRARLNQFRLPFALPLSVSLLALLDRLERKGELATYVPRLVSSLRFRRNTVRLGQKLVEHL